MQQPQLHPNLPKADPHFKPFPETVASTVPNEQYIKLHYNRQGDPSKLASLKSSIYVVEPLVMRVQNMALALFALTAAISLPRLFGLTLIGGQTLIAVTAFAVACIAINLLLNKILEWTEGSYKNFLKKQI